jgi:hypothetical protein
MKPTMDEAVLLAARCFHRNYQTSIPQPVHLNVVAHAVARIHRVPEQDGLIRILLREEVKKKVRELEGKVLLVFESLGSNKVCLTRAGSDRAASIEQSQLWIDTGIVGRIQDYSRFETRSRVQEPEREQTLERGGRGYSMGL